MTEQEYTAWQESYAKEQDGQKRKAMLDAALAQEDAHREETALRLRFWQQRYGTTQKGKPLQDRYITVWLELVYTTKNVNLWFGKKRVARELAGHLTTLGAQIAKEGALAAQLFEEELLSAVHFYLYTCTKDGKYGSQVFGMMPMGQEQLIRKIAEEIYQVTFYLPGVVGMQADYAPLFRAGCAAFEEKFPGEAVLIRHMAAADGYRIPDETEEAKQ